MAALCCRSWTIRSWLPQPGQTAPQHLRDTSQTNTFRAALLRSRSVVFLKAPQDKKKKRGKFNKCTRFESPSSDVLKVIDFCRCSLGTNQSHKNNVGRDHSIASSPQKTSCFSSYETHPSASPAAKRASLNSSVIWE